MAETDLALTRCRFLCLTGLFIAVVIAYGGLYGYLPGIKAEAQPEVMNNFRAVFVTTPNIEVAKKIAQ